MYSTALSHRCVVMFLLGFLVVSIVVANETEKAAKALNSLGAAIERSDEGKVLAVDLSATPGINAGLEHVQTLNDLQRIELPPRTNDAGLAHLANLAHLEMLNLRPLQDISDAGLEHIRGLTQLKALSLPTQVTDAALKNLVDLTSLKQLNLSYCRKITDEGITSLATLPLLEELNLRGAANVSDAACEHLASFNDRHLGLIQ